MFKCVNEFVGLSSRCRSSSRVFLHIVGIRPNLSIIAEFKWRLYIYIYIYIYVYAAFKGKTCQSCTRL